MIFYRIRAYVDFMGDSFGNEVAKCEVEKWFMLRETPRGFWVIPDWVETYPEYSKEKYKRWISKTSTKRYCYPTLQEAMISFRKRCQRRISLAEYALQNAKAIYELSKEEFPLTHYGKVVER